MCLDQFIVKTLHLKENNKAKLKLEEWSQSLPYSSFRCTRYGDSTWFGQEIETRKPTVMAEAWYKLPNALVRNFS